jgi:methionine biosynthesis protein MetW
MIKILLYKLKQDLLSLGKYPVSKLSGDKVDYDQYWSKRRSGTQAVLSRWQKHRADIILEMIGSGSSVMDLGCGDGAVLKYLREKGGIEGVGVDISDKVLAQAKEIGITAIKKDITDLNGLDDLPEVDYILGLEIIEHMPNPEEFIFRIKEKSKNGMIFSFPNSGYYAHRLRLLFGRFPAQWVSHPGEHLRFWTVRDVSWWTGAMDLKLEKLIVYEGLPFLNRIFPSVFGRGIIIKLSR